MAAALCARFAPHPRPLVQFPIELTLRRSASVALARITPTPARPHRGGGSAWSGPPACEPAGELRSRGRWRPVSERCPYPEPSSRVHDIRSRGGSVGCI